MDQPGTPSIALARQRFALRDYHGTILLLREAIAAGHDWPDVQHLLGLAYSMIERPDEALAAFDAAIRRNPRYLEAQLNRAVLLAGQGHEEAAQAGFALVGELERPDRSGFAAHVGNRLANTHAALGQEYRQAGALEEATVQFRRALELRPAFPDVRIALARTLLEMGRHAEAATELDVVIGARPDLVDATLLRGLAAYLLGSLDEAGRHWAAAARVAPDEPRIASYQAMLARRRAGRG